MPESSASKQTKLKDQEMFKKSIYYSRALGPIADRYYPEILDDLIEKLEHTNSGYTGLSKVLDFYFNRWKYRIGSFIVFSILVLGVCFKNTEAVLEYAEGSVFVQILIVCLLVAGYCIFLRIGDFACSIYLKAVMPLCEIKNKRKLFVEMLEFVDSLVVSYIKDEIANEAVLRIAVSTSVQGVANRIAFLEKYAISNCEEAKELRLIVKRVYKLPDFLSRSLPEKELLFQRAKRSAEID